MELNRNNLLLWGVLLLFFGLQFHYFDSYILTEKASNVYFDRFEKKSKPPEIKNSFLEDAPQVTERKTIKPPIWLGRCLMSVGAVLIFQSFIVKRME